MNNRSELTWGETPDFYDCFERQLTQRGFAPLTPDPYGRNRFHEQFLDNAVKNFFGQSLGGETTAAFLGTVAHVRVPLVPFLDVRGCFDKLERDNRIKPALELLDWLRRMHDKDGIYNVPYRQKLDKLLSPVTFAHVQERLEPLVEPSPDRVLYQYPLENVYWRSEMSVVLRGTADEAAEFMRVKYPRVPTHIVAHAALDRFGNLYGEDGAWQNSAAGTPTPDQQPEFSRQVLTLYRARKLALLGT